MTTFVTFVLILLENHAIADKKLSVRVYAKLIKRGSQPSQSGLKAQMPCRESGMELLKEGSTKLENLRNKKTIMKIKKLLAQLE